MIVVTGVHRSGTSLLSQLLQAFGLDFGPEQAFYAPDQWNERGYLERRDVMDLNSRIVTGFRRTEGTIAPFMSKVGYLTISPEWAIRRRGRRFSTDVEKLASRLDGLAVKDPRFCLTLPEWVATGELDRIIVTVRHPHEVARSLRTRQRVPLAVGYRFWDRHMRPLLDHLDADAVVIDHADLTGPDPVPALRRIADFAGATLDSSALLERYHATYSPRLTHERLDGDVRLPAATDKLWHMARRRLSTTAAP